MPLSYDDAPYEFRMLVIPAMLKVVDWKTLKKLTLDSYSGLRPPDEFWPWLVKDQYPALTPDGRPEGAAFHPLLTCMWRIFFLTMGEASIHGSREAMKRLESARASGDPELIESRRMSVDRELEAGGRFVDFVNNLFRRFRLGYTLRGGEFFRTDLKETAILREKASEASMDLTLQADMVTAWNALNATPIPNHREAVRSIRNVVEYVRGELDRHLGPQGKNDASKTMRKGLDKLIGAASELAAHPSGSDPTRADAIGLVNITFALVGYLNALVRETGRDTGADQGAG